VNVIGKFLFPVDLNFILNLRLILIAADSLNNTFFVLLGIFGLEERNHVMNIFIKAIVIIMVHTNIITSFDSSFLIELTVRVVSGGSAFIMKMFILIQK
jgi:hypothetical protein